MELVWNIFLEHENQWSHQQILMRIIPTYPPRLYESDNIVTNEENIVRLLNRWFITHHK